MNAQSKFQLQADELISSYESDKDARSEWEFRYKQGLETLDPNGGQNEEENQKITTPVSIFYKSFEGIQKAKLT